MMNRLRKPDDRKGQVRFDAAGAGNEFTVELVRRQTKETEQIASPTNAAPVLDPTVPQPIRSTAKRQTLRERRAGREITFEPAFS